MKVDDYRVRNSYAMEMKSQLLELRELEKEFFYLWLPHP